MSAAHSDLCYILRYLNCLLYILTSAVFCGYLYFLLPFLTTGTFADTSNVFCLPRRLLCSQKPLVSDAHPDHYYVLRYLYYPLHALTSARFSGYKYSLLPARISATFLYISTVCCSP